MRLRILILVRQSWRTRYLSLAGNDTSDQSRRRDHDGQFAEREHEETRSKCSVAKSETNGNDRHRRGGLDLLETRHGDGEERLQRRVVESLHRNGEQEREVERQGVPH